MLLSTFFEQQATSILHLYPEEGGSILVQSSTWCRTLQRFVLYVNHHGKLKSVY